MHIGNVSDALIGTKPASPSHRSKNF